MFSTTTGKSQYLTPSAQFPKIMFCGDSTSYANGGTAGFGAYKQHFSNRVKTLYGFTLRAGIDIVGSTNNNVCSFGMCGAAGITATQLNTTYLPTNLSTHSPTHCFVKIGINNVLSGDSTNTIITQINACLDTIRAARPTCAVTLCKLIDRNSYTSQVNALNSEIGNLVLSRGDSSFLTSFDANALLGPYSVANYNDDTHPNDTGYTILGNGIADFFYGLYPLG